MSDLLSVLIVLALIASNAFFVIGEYTVVTARRSALAPRADMGSAGAKAALRLMDDPVRVISTVQVGITAIGILTGAIGQSLIREMLNDAIPQWLSFVIAFSLITYLSVVFGELVPKALTLDRAETLAVLVAPPIELISVAFHPVVWLLQGSAQLLLRPFGVREVTAGDTIATPDELRALVDEAEGAGVIPTTQEEMLHNVFDFVGHQARDVMVPALDVAWLDGALDPDAALQEIVEGPHGRYPVGDGSLDRLLGIVRVHQLIAARRQEPRPTVADLARPAPIVPETKDVETLLREMRAQRHQLAIVVDEYGGTAGIVTVEDIVEELVGEIDDENDPHDDTLTWLDDRTARVAGSTAVHDFNQAVGAELPEDGPRTVAGLAFSHLGRRPEPQDDVTLGDVRLTVEETEGSRITKLLARLPAPPVPDPARRIQER